MCVALLCPAQETAVYVAPAFDAGAQSGTPTVPTALNYVPLEVQENYVVYLCTELIVWDNSADVYFTNDSGNDVWVKLRIYNESDEIIAETGIIKQGEYLQTIEFTQPLVDGQAVQLKVMAYEPETYYSAGAFLVNLGVQLGGET